MVKSGGELPEGTVAALIHTPQPLSSPEWKFPLISRPKTKRPGTPLPEKTRRALKRSGFESCSEVSRAKKKMVLEMAENLFAGFHGEEKGSSENEQALLGEMLSSLAQMAKNERAPTIEMEGLDCEGVAENLSAPASRDLGESRNEGEMVNQLTVASTTHHVQTTLDVGVACEVLDACDSQKKEKTNSTLHGHGNDGPIMEKANLISKSAPCAIHLSLVNNGEEIPNSGSKGDRGPDAQPPDFSPKKLDPSANAWKATENPSSRGATGYVEGAATSHNPRKAEPFSLDAGKIKPLGTAGLHEGTPSLSFTDMETEFLSEKLGLAIVGKFSHSLPSTHQIQKSLGSMELVGSFTWKYLNAKHILLQFHDVADYAKVLNGPNGSPIWYINIHPMRVFKWTPDFDTFFESPIVPVWCNIMGIPVHLFEESALMAIGKLLGKPLQVDHATINQTRLSFARICVEIDISIPPADEILLNILGKESRHKVAWDRIPLFCANCKHVGHVKDWCHASGRKKRVGSMDLRTTTSAYHTVNVSKTIRREWRPKAATWAGTSTSTGHSTKEKESDTQEKSKESTMDADSSAPRASNQSQPIVDDDGFQLVSRKRKGKAHDGDMHIKAQHIDNLHMKANVATVSFGIDNSGANEPGICSMSVSCGAPSREMEGSVEELDPGGTVPCGGIPIAGLN